MKKFSQYQISSITFLLNDSKIPEEISKTLGLHKSTVAKYRRKLVDQTSPPVRGRLRRLISRDKRALACLMTNDGTKKAAEAVKKLILKGKVKFSLLQ